MGLLNEIFRKKEPTHIDRVNIQSSISDEDLRIPEPRKVIKMVRRVNVEWSDGTEVSFDGKIISVDADVVIIKNEADNENRVAYAFRNIGENKMVYASEELEEE